MKFLSLFAGIGGFDLGFERAGMTCVGQVENNEFCLKVLEKHWPDIKKIKDIKDVKGDEFGTVDFICGGFPCQPFSCAGKRQGKKDDRYFWKEMFRIIEVAKPTWVLGENVPGIVNLALDDVYSDLENAGYEVQPIIIPACAIGAPHRRDRVWIIAYSSINRLSYKEHKQKLEEKRKNKFFSCQSINNWWKIEPSMDRVVNGIPGRMDRLKALGNAVVPQIAEILGKYIMKNV
jgi:DNA (cytosine-5)-methyltransferase 1